MNNNPDNPVACDIPELDPGEPNYQSLDEVFHEVYAECGEEGLREVLGPFSIARESLDDAADALELAGKLSIAAVVRDIATTKLSGIDLDNPYKIGSLNWDYWRHSWMNKRRMKTGELSAILHRKYGQKSH